VCVRVCVCECVTCVCVGLPPTYDDPKLVRLFTPYGKIVDVKVLLGVCVWVCVCVCVWRALGVCGR